MWPKDNKDIDPRERETLQEIAAREADEQVLCYKLDLMSQSIRQTEEDIRGIAREIEEHDQTPGAEPFERAALVEMLEGLKKNLQEFKDQWNEWEQERHDVEAEIDLLQIMVSAKLYIPHNEDIADEEDEEEKEKSFRLTERI